MLVGKSKMPGTAQCFECERIWHQENNKKRQGQIDTSKPKSVEKKSFVDGLSGKTRERYLEKRNLIDGVDLYEIDHRSWKYDLSLYPAITYTDLVFYLSNTSSPYTLEDFKAYKSLEAFNQFLSGWVKEIRFMEIGGNRVVSARVSVNFLSFSNYVHFHHQSHGLICYSMDYIMKVDWSPLALSTGNKRL